MYDNDFIEFNEISIDELISVLLDIQRKYGKLPIYTFNQNDCSIDYNYVLSNIMQISVEDIIKIDDRVYIKNRDYDEWLSDNVDSNEDYFIEIISKKHPELKDIAIKILRDEFIDDDWEDNWNAITPIIYNYYLNDLNWKEVVLITNYS